jgi:carboxypeptidase D
LAGLLIGNGWISPKEQYEAYLQYGYARGIVEKNSDVANKLEVQHRICQKELAINEVDRSSCEAVLQEMLRLTAKPGPNGKLQCYNMYDIRLQDDFPACGMNWPPDLTSVTPYLRRKDVTDALHVNAAKNTGWHECDGAVGTQFRATKSRPSVEILPDILKEIPIILFSGAEDLICSHLGTEALISNMAWNGGRGFELSPGTWAPRRAWTFEGEEAGFWQTARNLTYVLFNNSSHMVPFDYPRRTRDMLDRFMGVDISSIGGQPTDSRLDGEKGPETTVGGAAGNGTADQNAEKAKVDAIKWEAYRKSGEIVLVIVAVAAAAWGYYIWRDRRKSRDYQVLAGGENGHAAGRRGVADRGRAGGLENFRSQRANRDIEAGDFDESELDDLHLRTPTDAANDDRYSVGGESEESVDEKGSKEKQNGQSSKA